MCAPILIKKGNNMLVQENIKEKDISYIECTKCGEINEIERWDVIEVEFDDLTALYTVCPVCDLHVLIIVKDDELQKSIDRYVKEREAFNQLAREGAPVSVQEKAVKNLRKLQAYNEKRAQRLKESHPELMSYQGSLNTMDSNTVESEGRNENE